MKVKVSQFCLVTQSYPTLCSPMDCSMPGLPCPSPTPGTCSDSCPLSQWCHLTISSSVIPFSLCLQSTSLRVFSMESVLCLRWPKYWSFSFSISPSNEYSGLISFRMDWFNFLAVQGTLKSHLQHHSTKLSILLCSAFFIVQLSHPYMTTGKATALTRWTFVSKPIMSLLFNMLSRLVITFLPRCKCLLISWLQSPSAVILETKKMKSVTVSMVSPSIYHEVMGPDTMIFVFWMLSFKPAFSLSSFTFIKKLFSSPLSAIRVLSSAYLRLLIFLTAILIPTCISPSPAFQVMYSAYELNTQGDGIQSWCTPFPIWNQSIVPCPILFLLDLHTDFSGGRSVGLVFPSLEEFSTVCCDLQSEIFSVMSNSLWPHWLCRSWNSPGQNTGVCCHSVLQGIFLTQELNPDLPHFRWILYKVSLQGSP